MHAGNTQLCIQNGLTICSIATGLCPQTQEFKLNSVFCDSHHNIKNVKSVYHCIHYIIEVYFRQKRKLTF